MVSEQRSPSCHLRIIHFLLLLLLLLLLFLLLLFSLFLEASQLVDSDKCLVNDPDLNLELLVESLLLRDIGRQSPLLC